jgi:hypothetical protein
MEITILKMMVVCSKKLHRSPVSAKQVLQIENSKQKFCGEVYTVNIVAEGTV